MRNDGPTPPALGPEEEEEYFRAQVAQLDRELNRMQSEKLRLLAKLREPLAPKRRSSSRKAKGYLIS